MSKDNLLINKIRASSEYQNHRLEALIKEDYNSRLSRGSSFYKEHPWFLEVHHIIALSTLIKIHKINKSNWKDFKKILFAISNTSLLNQKEHFIYHYAFGNQIKSTRQHIEDYFKFKSFYIFIETNQNIQYAWKKMCSKHVKIKKSPLSIRGGMCDVAQEGLSC